MRASLQCGLERLFFLRFRGCLLRASTMATLSLPLTSSAGCTCSTSANEKEEEEEEVYEVRSCRTLCRPYELLAACERAC